MSPARWLNPDVMSIRPAMLPVLVSISRLAHRAVRLLSVCMYAGFVAPQLDTRLSLSALISLFRVLG